MLKMIFNTTLSVKEGASRGVLRGIVQHDTLNEVNIRLSDGAKAFDYYGYTNIIFKVLKPDGTSHIDSEGENVIATSPEDGIVTVILGGQATAAAGLNQAVIEIYADGEKMTTARLTSEVFEELGVDEDAVASEDDYPVLQNLMFSMENGYVTRAEKAANEAELWAKASQDVAEGDFATRAELEAVKNGAAPAGYGLGEETPSVVDMNDAVVNGWYRSIGDTTENYPALIPGAGGAYCTLFVQTRGIHIYQEARYQNYIAIRHCENNTWREWEYVNPPMSVGVEYRTTERCDGKPVYVQRFSLGALPVSGTKAYYFTTKVTAAIRVVRANIIAKQTTSTRETTHTLPMIGNTGDVMAFAYVVSRLDGGDRPVVNISVMTDCSAYNGVAEIWYTKDTDT